VRVGVLGAGSWGTALAIEFARSGHEVLLWGRDPEVAASIQADGRHPRRLEGFTIPPTLSLRTLVDIALHPGWWFDKLTTDPLQFAVFKETGGTVADLMNSSGVWYFSSLFSE